MRLKAASSSPAPLSSGWASGCGYSAPPPSATASPGGPTPTSASISFRPLPASARPIGRPPPAARDSSRLVRTGWRRAFAALAVLFFLTPLGLIALGLVGTSVGAQGGFLDGDRDPGHTYDAQIRDNTRNLISEGRATFRYDTLGSERFFGDTIGLHTAIEGAKFGGVGPGVSPKTALAVGLKVDSDALPKEVVAAIQAGQVDLNDPGVTLTLLKLGAVVGVSGIFNNPDQPAQGLKAVGIQCALCHSTVDDSFAPGIGKRLDGWPNQDLNVGAIIGGWLFNVFGHVGATGLNLWSILVAFVGGVVLLWIVRALSGGRTSTA